MEIRDTPAAVPPPAPESAERWKLEKARLAKAFGLPEKVCLGEILEAVAHLQAELEQVIQMHAAAETEVRLLEKRVQSAETDRASWRRTAEKLEKEKQHAEARRRVLEEALANLLNVMKYSIGVGLRTPGQKDVITAAERALAPGQEEK